MKKIFLVLLLILLAGTALANKAFNIEIEVPETYESVPAGENLWFTSKLLNLDNEKRIDVTLKYDILDTNKQVIASKSETVAIETQASFVGSIKVPDHLKKGLYFLRATVIPVASPIGVSEAETSFNIIKEETKAFIVIKFSLFDIFVEIPDDYKKIHPGEELLSSIKLINLGSAGRVDVFLDYMITDSAGNAVLKKKETVAVETQANFVRIFDIPEDTGPGEYTLHAKITYADGKEAAAEHYFEIVRKEVNKQIYVIGTVVLVIAALIIITFITFSNFKTHHILEKLRIKNKVAEMVRKRLKK